MSYIRLVDVKVSARLGYELTAASLAFDISPRTSITATVDILPQTSLDPDTLIVSDQLLPFEIGKVVFDIMVTEDGIDSISIVKLLEDSVAITSDASLEVSRPVSDVTSLIDDFGRVFSANRQLLDTAVTLATPPVIAFGKSAVDATFTDSAVSLSLARTFSDELTLLDNAKVIQGIFVNVGRWFDINTWGKDTWDDAGYWEEDSGDEIHTVIMGSDFSYQAEFYRDFTDQLAAQDSFERQVDYQPLIIDTVVTESGITTVTFDKSITDSLVLQDVLERDVEYNRDTADTITLVSDVALSVGTIASDTTELQDTQQLSIQPSFSEVTESSDNITSFSIGVANLDVVVLQDDITLASGFNRNLGDITLIADEPALSFGTTSGDTTNIGDILGRDVDYNRGITNIVGSLDSITSFNIGTNALDSVSSVDVLARDVSYERGLVDTAGTTSNATLGVGVVATDVPVVADNTNLTAAKLLSDTPIILDQITSRVFTKSVVDTATTTDEVDLLYAVGRLLDDAVNSSDQGQYTYTAYWDDGATWIDTRSWVDSDTGQI